MSRCVGASLCLSNGSHFKGSLPCVHDVFVFFVVTLNILPGSIKTSPSRQIPVCLAPGMPSVPDVGTVPSVRNAPIAPNVCNAHIAPSATKMLNVPSMANMPSVPRVPAVHNVPSVPSAPDVPTVVYRMCLMCLARVRKRI